MVDSLHKILLVNYGIASLFKRVNILSLLLYITSVTTYVPELHDIVEPVNIGPFGDNINAADLLFVERFSPLGGVLHVHGKTKYIVLGIIPGL